VLWGVEVFALIPCYTSYLHTYAKKRAHGSHLRLVRSGGVHAADPASAMVVVCWASKLPTQAILTTAGLCYFTIIASTLWSQGARRLIKRSGHVAPTVLAEGPPPPP
jgi:hypothetical protein